MPRFLQQPSYVLHARSFRETSLLLEILSRDHGRIALVARGARRPKSRLRGVLQPFRPLLASWVAKGELGTLSGAEQVAAPPVLTGDALYCGMYLNELLIRLLHRNDPHADVFERYREVLAALSSGAKPQPALRLFEKHLLDAVGYGLILDQESGNGHPIDPEAHYEYRPGQGPVRLGSKGNAGRNSVSGVALQALASEQLDDHLLPELRSLMRRVIGYHLGDKPLVSAALFKGPANKTEQEHG